MSQVSTQLLQSLRNEYQKTGKKTFSTQDILSYLDDSKDYNQAIDELLRYKLIVESKYKNCFDLINF